MVGRGKSSAMPLSLAIILETIFQMFKFDISPLFCNISVLTIGCKFFYNPVWE